jgi:hypothetical protein
VDAVKDIATAMAATADVTANMRDICLERMCMARTPSGKVRMMS